MYNTKIWLRNRRHEHTTIYIRYNFTENGKKQSFNYALGERIKTSHWDDEEKRLKTKIKPSSVSAHNKRINAKIEEVREVIALAVEELKAREMPLSGLSHLVNKKLKGQPQKLTFIQHFERIISDRKAGREFTSKGRRYSHNVIKSYGSTITWLKEYESHYRTKILPDDVNLEFYNKFVGLMNFHNKSVNTIGGRVKHIKMVMRRLVRDGVTNNRSHEDPNFKKIQETSDSLYLNEDELSLINSLSLPPYLDRARDLFVVGCYTGLRFSDFSCVKPSNIINDGKMIKKITQKQTDTVYIPVHPIVKEILDKYSGKLPTLISNQKMNAYIKKIAKQAGLNQKEEFRITKGGRTVIEVFERWEKVSTHTARRSFATNFYLAGGDPLSIMPITGHKTIESFLKYIRVSREQHAKRMLDNHVWFKSSKSHD